jgi:large subunit ribosomal protein L28
MAKCDNCGRGTQFGNNRPWSKKATRRHWNLNIQKVKVMVGSKQVSKRLCTSCVRTLVKTA